MRYILGDLYSKSFNPLGVSSFQSGYLENSNDSVVKIQKRIESILLLKTKNRKIGAFINADFILFYTEPTEDWSESAVLDFDNSKKGFKL
jgi:hypothetical protein